MYVKGKENARSQSISGHTLYTNFTIHKNVIIEHLDDGNMKLTGIIK